MQAALLGPHLNLINSLSDPKSTYHHTGAGASTWIFCCLVTQSCLTLCNPMDCSIPGLPVPHHLPVCPSSCLLHQWCSPAISSSDDLFFCPQSFPASRTFPMSHLFASDDQTCEASASASIFPVNIQGWPSLRLTGWISLQSKGLSGVFSSTTVQRHQFFGALPSLAVVQLSQPYLTTGKIRALTIWTFAGRVMSLLFNILSRLVIAFLPRSNHLISRLQSLSTVILEPKRRGNQSLLPPFPPLFAMPKWGQMPWC